MTDCIVLIGAGRTSASLVGRLARVGDLTVVDLDSHRPGCGSRPQHQGPNAVPAHTVVLFHDATRSGDVCRTAQAAERVLLVPSHEASAAEQRQES